jgi:hypothetical protein
VKNYEIYSVFNMYWKPCAGTHSWSSEGGNGETARESKAAAANSKGSDSASREHRQDHERASKCFGHAISAAVVCEAAHQFCGQSRSPAGVDKASYSSRTKPREERKDA